MRRVGFISAGLAGALLIVSGCAPAAQNEPEETTAKAEDPAELAKRLAFMAGHVEAGIALYRAGEMEAAAKHMRHPISETHAEERAGLEKLGFDAEVFRTANDLLAEGADAGAAQEALTAAEDHLKQVIAKTGGQGVTAIPYLMDLIRKEYAAGIAGGKVADPGEYQDAWGFAKTARLIANDPATPNGKKVRAELETLIGLWSADAPVAPQDPASPAEVNAQVDAVLAALG